MDIATYHGLGLRSTNDIIISRYNFPLNYKLIFIGFLLCLYLRFFCLSDEISWLNMLCMDFNTLFIYSCSETKIVYWKAWPSIIQIDYVPEAARNCYWTTLWEMWWEVCNMWFLCVPLHTCSSLRWMQLWILPRSLCYLWRSGNFWCLLLQRVYTAGER